LGIWKLTHTVTTTDVFADTGELAEMQCDVSVETMPLRYGSSYRTFQTASHIHVIHMYGGFAPQIDMEVHMEAHSHRYRN